MSSKMSGLVFDDSASDSEDDLESFRNEMKKKVAPGVHPPVDDEDDDDDEDGDDDDDDSDEASLDSEDDMPNQPPKDDAVLKAKLGKLNSMLQTLEGGESSEDEESDNDDDDDPASDNDKDQTDNIEDASDHSDEEPEKLPETDYKSAKNLQSKKSAKRKGDQNDDKDSKKPKIFNEEEQRDKYRGALSKLSVEKILDIKNSLGDKVFNNKWEGGNTVKTQKVPSFKRDNKNRPREISSKKRVPKFREVIQVAKVEKRDPRFDPLCGEFDKKEFRKSYKFLKGVKEKELVTLKDQLKEARSEDRANLKYLIQRTENQLRAEKQTEEAEFKTAAEMAERVEAMNRGDRPVFKTKKTKREEDLVKSYETLKEKGGVDNFIRKMNKKNTSKDRKMLGKAMESQS